jgi:hypothetical protein
MNLPKLRLQGTSRTGNLASSQNPSSRHARLISMGAAVACRPLPHHRAYGSVHGGSRSYASSSRITKEDRASGSMHWKARQKGLSRGPGTRGHDHFQQCWLPVACVPQAATMPPDDGAWSSTAAKGASKPEPYPASEGDQHLGCFAEAEVASPAHHVAS